MSSPALPAPIARDVGHQVRVRQRPRPWAPRRAARGELQERDVVGAHVDGRRRRRLGHAFNRCRVGLDRPHARHTGQQLAEDRPDLRVRDDHACTPPGAGCGSCCRGTSRTARGSSAGRSAPRSPPPASPRRCRRRTPPSPGRSARPGPRAGPPAPAAPPRTAAPAGAAPRTRPEPRRLLLVRQVRVPAHLIVGDAPRSAAVNVVRRGHTRLGANQVRRTVKSAALASTPRATSPSVSALWNSVHRDRHAEEVLEVGQHLEALQRVERRGRGPGATAR
jgi:hypothetical protein